MWCSHRLWMIGLLAVPLLALTCGYGKGQTLASPAASLTTQPTPLPETPPPPCRGD